MEDMVRYSIIRDKNPREIVLLRGTGCRWRRCSFCDYHFDSDADEMKNYTYNRPILGQVTGVYHRLEVINSGSFSDLDGKTMDYILNICLDKQIQVVHFECHWIHRSEISALRERFLQKGIQVKIKTGVETFDYDMRENILHKGIGVKNPVDIAKPFDECCLLFGLSGQTEKSMQTDVEIGLKNFERVCVNLMTENTTPIKPDQMVLDVFYEKLYPLYVAHPRVDVLAHNTDFGVGGKNQNEE